MHKALHLRHDIDYVSGKEGGRGHAIIEAHIVISIQWLKDYIKKSKERLIVTVGHRIDSISTNKMTRKTRKHEWEEKQLYGYFKRQIGQISHEKTRIWL